VIDAKAAAPKLPLGWAKEGVLVTSKTSDRNFEVGHLAQVGVLDEERL
jgi:hypothetical protein